MQNPRVPIDEEETVSMRELVEQIDAHAELDETEATNIPVLMISPVGICFLPWLTSSRTKWPTRPNPSFHQLDCQTDSLLLLFILIVF